MPRFLEEIQLPSLDNVIKPRSGVSIYNDDGAIKVIHADGRTQQLMVGDELGNVDFSQYYTRTEIDAIIAGIDIGDIDLSDYYTKSEIDAFLADIANRTDLENYYTKTEINNKDYASKTYVNDRMTAVDNRVNEILNGAPAKFDTLKEIADAFDAEDGVYAILEGKQDVLTEADFKTIGGVSVFGAGEIEIPVPDVEDVDLTNYYTKDDTYSKTEVDTTTGVIDQKVENLNLTLTNNYATRAETELAIETAKTELTGDITELSNTVDTKANSADVYTKTEVDSKIDSITAGDIDLQNYYTKTEVDNAIDTEITALIDGAPDALNTLKEIAQTLENDYPKTTYLESQISELRTDLDGKATKTDVTNLETAVTNNNTNITNLTTDVEKNYVKKSSLSNDYYNKDAVDSKLSSKANTGDLNIKIAETQLLIDDVPVVSANITASGSEQDLETLSIDGVVYNVLSDEIVFSSDSKTGANNLRSITVGDVSWNIVGSGGGGSADLSDYYNKTEVENAIDNKIAAIVDDAPEIYNTFKEIANYIESDLTSSAEMLSSINSKANSADVYTKTEVNNTFLKKSEAPVIPDMSNYYNKQETEDVIQDAIAGVTGVDLRNYYTKEEIDATVETINANKQNKLTAGEGITISETGVISSTGGSGGGGSAEMIFSDEADETGTPLRTIKVGTDVWSIPEGGGSGGGDMSNYYTKEEIANLNYQTNDQVNDKIAALINSAPDTLDTLGELATALNSNKELVETLDAAITNKADKTELANYVVRNNPKFYQTARFINQGLGEVPGLTVYSFGDYTYFGLGTYNNTLDENNVLQSSYVSETSNFKLKTDGLYFNDTKLATVNDVGSGGGNSNVYYINIQEYWTGLTETTIECLRHIALKDEEVSVYLLHKEGVNTYYEPAAIELSESMAIFKYITLSVKDSTCSTLNNRYFKFEYDVELDSFKTYGNGDLDSNSNTLEFSSESKDEQIYTSQQGYYFPNYSGSYPRLLLLKCYDEVQGKYYTVHVDGSTSRGSVLGYDGSGFFFIEAELQNSDTVLMYIDSYSGSPGTIYLKNITWII